MDNRAGELRGYPISVCFQMPGRGERVGYPDERLAGGGAEQGMRHGRLRPEVELLTNPTNSFSVMISRYS